ncbi:hypothetical protein N7537_011090 [Penicillium hordei]|uniref:Uncharacterized protein n=1 Tax=Penicillium hordei TaxID=40994 RepID=A0AAD6DL75_9EURO|nr:uncharacterized protein N7537_011090 [Penicillium hordei]KAJ5588412.1 hypothetical protein N7537_011090 [Penicillium hordei]
MEGVMRGAADLVGILAKHINSVVRSQIRANIKENYQFDRFKFESREKEEIEEIVDEEKFRIAELEKLLDELKIKFDELGHPVLEFLEGYWRIRMIEVLSQRDPYDEEHAIESRRIGVTLELDEYVVPDRISLLIGSNIMYEIST